MSGVELALGVVGVIGSAIAIIDASKKIYDAASDQRGLPQAFRDVGTKLPIVIELLRKAEAYVGSRNLAEDTRNKIEQLIVECKAHAQSLKELFESVCRVEGEKRRETYKKLWRTVGNGHKLDLVIFRKFFI